MAVADPILEPLRADPERAAILCDIDGTLAPIAEDPASAAVPAPAREALRALARRYRLVACISGRRASAARRMVGLEELTYAGNHGLEVLDPGAAEPRVDPALGDRGDVAAEFVATLEWEDLGALGLRLEDKGPIQAIHWRGSDREASAAQRAAELAELAAGQGLVVHWGRLVLELRPLAEIDKGVATRRLVESTGVTAALFGGDDRTDLDAFAALAEMVAGRELERGIRVAVASPEGPPELQREADLVVGGPEGFLDLLRGL